MWGVKQKYNIKYLRITFFFIQSTPPTPPLFRGPNVIGKINIIINKMIILCFVGNLLQAMTALSVDLPRDCVSSFVMLCQAFTAAEILFVGLSTFSFVFSKWNACSIGLRSGDWLGHFRIIHYVPSKTPVLLLLYFLGHRTFVLWSAI